LEAFDGCNCCSSSGVTVAGVIPWDGDADKLDGWSCYGCLVAVVIGAIGWGGIDGCR
nr:hypothetical protein [Tanacetum cinerariifolium]